MVPGLAERPARYLLGAINLIDLVIIVAALIGVANGYRRGFWLSLFQYLGLVVGVGGGAAVAPAVPAAPPPTNRGRVAPGLVLVISGSRGSTIGFGVGEPVRRAILGRGFARPPEQLAGALFSLF